MSRDTLSTLHGCPFIVLRTSSPWLTILIIAGWLWLAGCRWPGAAPPDPPAGALPPPPALPGSPAPVVQPAGMTQPAAPPASRDPYAPLKDPMTVVALVGDQPILSGDLLPTVDQMLQPYAGRIPEEQLQEQRLQLIKQLLERRIQFKLLYLDFLRTLPADRRETALADIRKRAEEQFEKEELPRLLERTDTENAAKLDAVLRRYGSSLEATKRDYVEQLIARSMVGRKVDRNPEITRQELLQYYQEHLDRYTHRARARWEQLTVRFDRFATREEAWRAIAEMGNQVLRGAPLEAVARKHSQGVNASLGGYHDWTTQGSLRSEVLDQAIFSLPIGQLSPILEDETGFHIVRVLEREEAGTTPFEKAQEEIRQQLRQEKIQRQIDQLLHSLRQEIPVWTYWDLGADG